MYFNILKRDIKRKKVANIIVLLFVILSSMFVSSSVSNFRTIISSLDEFMEQANIGDYFLISMGETEECKKIESFLEENEEVDSWRKETLLEIGINNMYDEELEKIELTNIYWFVTPTEGNQVYFDENDKKISEVNPGEIYLLPKFAKEIEAVKGDTLFFKEVNQDTGEEDYKEYKVAGIMKDAIFDSSIMGGARLLINNDDYQETQNEKKYNQNYMYIINTENPNVLEQNLSEANLEKIVILSLETVKLTYFLDMVIAGILLIVSVCLILISLLILRFILVFTISEEFREIGIMKAIGVKNRKIRMIYVIKYFVIAFVGSVIGYLCGLPFAKMLLKSVSTNCLIVPDHTAKILGLISSILIGFVVLLFSFTSTKRIKKLSPMVAIRNGQDGKRFHKKGFMKLRKSKVSVSTFMAANDVFSYVRRYLILFIIFMIGTILIIVPAITADTLKSEEMIELMAMHTSDVYLMNTEEGETALLNNEVYSYSKNEIKFIENKISDMGYSGFAFYNVTASLKIQKGGNMVVHNAYQGVNISADQFACLEGHQPMYENEVSLTKYTAEAIGAEIGDMVEIYIGTETIPEKFIVSGLFQSFNNLGQGMRFYEDLDLQDSPILTLNSFQYTFDEELSDKEIKERITQIKKEFNGYWIADTQECIKKMMGDTSEQVDNVKWLILIVMTCIDMLVTILMVKSFIIKDKIEIALLKAIGFSNRNIMMWQIKRIGIILFISTLIGILLSNPVAKITSSKVFVMMGVENIQFVFDPFKSFLLYPGIVICATLFASVIATLQVRHIKSSEINSIE